jgi:hypothetical protein
VWPLLDEVCLEIPPAGGESTSVRWMVIVCVWPSTFVDVNDFWVVGGGGVVEPEHLDWTNAARAPNEPNSPVTRKFFLVMLISFKKRRADFPFFPCAYPIY